MNSTQWENLAVNDIMPFVFDMWLKDRTGHSLLCCTGNKPGIPIWLTSLQERIKVHIHSLRRVEISSFHHFTPLLLHLSVPTQLTNEAQCAVQKFIKVQLWLDFQSHLFVGLWTGYLKNVPTNLNEFCGKLSHRPEIEMIHHWSRSGYKDIPWCLLLCGFWCRSKSSFRFFSYTFSFSTITKMSLC